MGVLHLLLLSLLLFSRRWLGSFEDVQAVTIRPTHSQLQFLLLFVEHADCAWSLHSNKPRMPFLNLRRANSSSFSISSFSQWILCALPGSVHPLGFSPLKSPTLLFIVIVFMTQDSNLDCLYVCIPLLLDKQSWIIHFPRTRIVKRHCQKVLFKWLSHLSGVCCTAISSTLTW